MKTKLLLLLVVAGYYVSAQQPMPNTPGFNYFSTAISSDENYVYIGGPTTGGNNLTNSSWLNLENNTLNCVFADSSLYPELRYIITAGIPTSDGGWYLSRITHWDMIRDDIKYRKNSIIKLTSDRTEDKTFSIPPTNGIVSALFLQDNFLYVGGRFDSIGDYRCNGIARIDLEKMAVDQTWVVKPSNGSQPSISSICADNEFVYFGGRFSTVNDVARNNLARVKISDGKLDMNWNPGTNNTVNQIIIIEEHLYLGGRFDQVGGSGRNNVARINKNDGKVDPGWNTNFQKRDDCRVHVAGNHLYVGSDFQYTESGENRIPVPYTNLSRYDLNTGIHDFDWKPDFQSHVINLASAGNELFVGGAQIDTTTSLLEKFNLLTGEKDQNFKPNISGGWIITLVANNNKLLISGIIQLKNSVIFDGICRFHKTTGKIDEYWKPGLYTKWKMYVNHYDEMYPVHILPNKEHVYIGGSYRILSIFNNDESDLALMAKDISPLVKTNTYTGAIDENWGKDLFGEIYTMVQTEEFLYLGGVFATMEPDSIPYLARVYKATGKIDYSWNPAVNGPVNKLIIDGDMLYVGGHFDSINARPFQNLARLSLQNGQVDDRWQPNPDKTVLDLLVDEKQVFATGKFTTIGGASMPTFAKVDKNNGLASNTWLFSNEYWPLNLEKINNEIATIAIIINSETDFSQKILRINKETGLSYEDWQITHEVTKWNMNGYYHVMLFRDKIIYVGGNVVWSDVHSVALFSRYAIPDPLITIQPHQASPCETTGELIQIEVYSEAHPVSYQWQVKLNGTAWTDISDTQSQALNTAEINPDWLANEFRCLISDRNGQAISESFTINFFNHYEATETIEICDGTAIDWRGKNYASAGIYYDSLTSVHGCDSIAILQLSILPAHVLADTVEICQGEAYTWQGKTFTTTGTYEEKFQTKEGCDSTHFLQLTVNPGYEFFETASLCPGESFSWRGNNYNEPGTYSQSLSSHKGCDSIYNLELTLTELDPSITANELLLIANQEDASYQWIDCNDNNLAIAGETEQTFAVKNSGSYACAITKNNCTVISECIVVNVVGVNELASETDIRIFPNPSIGKLFVNLSPSFIPSSICVINLSGQVVASFLYEFPEDEELDLSNLREGCYLLSVQHGNKIAWKKILISK